MSVHKPYKTESPPKVAESLEPPLADWIKFDWAYSHLRASAGIYADALADEIVHQFEAESWNKIKQIKKAFAYRKALSL